MTTSLPSAPDSATPARGRGARALGVLRLAAAAGLLGASALLGWQGGGWGAGMALVSALALPWLLRPQRRADEADALDPLLDMPRVSGGRVGAEVMVSQVVPVWGKQLDITRTAASEGLAQLLESFSAMAGALGDLAGKIDDGQVSLAPGAVDAAIEDDSPARTALQALLASSRRAFAQRDAAVAELVNCSNALQELRQMGRQARELGKHTRLVAFNASIEANRGSGGGGTGRDGGNQAVADETRMLASRIAEVGEQIERLVSRLDRSLTPERLRGEVGDTTPEELEQELALAARTALGGLLGALGGALRSSGDVKAAAQTLSQQLEETFVHFQFGDRLSQMLDIVARDMQHFAHWVAANPYATQSDAADWLAKLEASYTMEEQRSQHHGNVHIDRGSEIEFF